jgi:hypothetical protein
MILAEQMQTSPTAAEGIELLAWLPLFMHDAAQWLAVAIFACLGLIVYRRVAQP